MFYYSIQCFSHYKSYICTRRITQVIKIQQIHLDLIINKRQVRGS